MRVVAVFLAVGLGAVLPAHSAAWPSFDDVRSQYQSYQDPSRLSYLYNRCAALQLNVAALFQRSGQKKAAADIEQLAQHYMVLSQANERDIDKKRGKDSKDTVGMVNYVVGTLSEEYSKRFKRNMAQRGDAVRGDAQLEAEVQECMSPEAFVKKALAH
jgi:hypothetical protein